MNRLKNYFLSIAIVFSMVAVNGCSTIKHELVINYTDPVQTRLDKAGIVEKQSQVGDITFNYAEGPCNGPSLLLFHAQHMDWYTYSPVLPELSKKYHVFALDYQGHGKTVCPVNYPMNANQIGTDISKFITQIIKEPVFVSGNSSGGLLTLWLAANRPEQVKSIVLEDPPLFSSEYPEIKNTISYKSFTTCYNYLQDNTDQDFLLYWLESSSQFVAHYAGKSALPKLEKSIKSYRSSNPGAPLEIGYLPEIVRNLVRGLNYFDPKFGAAFYEGTWNKDFEHTAALKKVTCPALLIHADFEILDNGILNGALDQREADKAMSLLSKGTYVKVKSSHVVHEDIPDQYIKLVEDFCLNK